MNKILFISHGLNVGGAEKFLISLSNSLSDSFKVKIVAISPGKDLLPELSNLIEFHEIKRKRKIDINTIFNLRKLILENPDSVICTMDFFCFLYYRLASFGSGNKRRVYISYHSTLLKSKKEYFLTKIYVKFLRKNDRIITVSKNQANFTANYFKIKKDKFYTIHNGINLDKWKIENAASLSQLTRNKFAIPHDSKVITITATFRKEKNHKMALQALKCLHDKFNTPAYLVLVGGGDMFDEIENQVNNLNLNKYVIFTGNQQDIKPYYYSSNIFSLTSDKIETFSIAALEAMACGIPCVLTDIGGANEMIENGTNGFLCDVNVDSIAETWYKALSSNFSNDKIQKIVYERFNETKMVNQYKTIFNN
jgi:glycosyltransferase involved in cell wall biosynthesis